MDRELVEHDLALRFLRVNPVEDEILELGVVVKLLTQQFTARSSVGVEIEEDQLVIDFGLGVRLVQGTLEPFQVLGERRGGEHKHDG
jgi:hypothetical protein